MLCYMLYLRKRKQPRKNDNSYFQDGSYIRSAHKADTDLLAGWGVSVSR